MRQRKYTGLFTLVLLPRVQELRREQRPVRQSLTLGA